MAPTLHIPPVPRTLLPRWGARERTSPAPPSRDPQGSPEEHRLLPKPEGHPDALPDAVVLNQGKESRRRTGGRRQGPGSGFSAGWTVRRTPGPCWPQRGGEGTEGDSPGCQMRARVGNRRTGLGKFLGAASPALYPHTPYLSPATWSPARTAPPPVATGRQVCSLDAGSARARMLGRALRCGYQS